MAETQDVSALRRRGRRRLVGAIALVLLAAIILPMVFDPEPPVNVPPVSLRIPAEDDSAFAPKVTPKPGASTTPAPIVAEAPKAAPVPAVQKAPEPAAAPKAEKPAAPVVAKPAIAPEKPQAAATGEQFVVPVAALGSETKLKELMAKLKAAKLPYYTEPLATAKGNVTRVRVGPYSNREAAEQAQRELQRLGLKPGNVLAKS